MSVQLTETVIKLLCGRSAYDKGDAYFRLGKVTLADGEPDRTVYEATVEERGGDYAVTAEIDGDGDVFAVCECPSFASASGYCEHIAAVLLQIREERSGDGPPFRAGGSLLDREEGFSGMLTRRDPRLAGGSRAAGSAESDARLVGGMLGLFAGRPRWTSGRTKLFDARETLEVEFTCSPVSCGRRQHLLGIGMRIGAKRLYVVQKTADFLGAVERRESYVFSKLFTYDPELHSFRDADDAVIRQLIRIVQHERIYRETSGAGYYSEKWDNGGGKELTIPPFAWDALLPSLLEAPAAKLEQRGSVFEGIRLTDEPLPLRFEFTEAEEAEAGGYRLNVEGLDAVTVLEAYGVVLAEGRLLQAGSEQCGRLSELQRMLEGARKRQVRIAPEQIEPFMEKVVPGLMKLGSVRIDERVSGRIVRTPLKARIYLDRVRDRLLAGLEFQYGDIVVNPLEESGRQRGEGRILMRDGEQEGRILSLMEQADGVKTEGGYIWGDEDAEYEFLHHIVPQLEKLADIYATSAVKARLFAGHAPPKVTVDFDERTDWLEFKFDIDGIPQSELRHLIRSLEEKRRYHRLPGGALMPLETAEFQEIARVLNATGFLPSELSSAEGTAGIRLPVVRGLHLIDSQRQGDAVKLGKSLRRLLENMRNPDNLDFPVPDSLEHVLRDYQKFGFQWLKTLAHYRFGGILADDMGLGKTVQSIAFVVSVLPEIRKEGEPALIVAPASLMYNWLAELRKFAPDVRAFVADGSKAERGKALKNAAGADVIITSYPLLRRDIGLYGGQAFHTLILDEAQAFKNHATQTAQAVKAVSAKYRFALTGTPVENRIEELWSIFDAVFPELFPGRQAFGDLSREAVAKRARPFLLRRLKTDVLKELPEKIESLQASELLPEQKKLYAAYLVKLRQETLKHLNEDGFRKHRIKILAGITRLRQLCCHPALFVEGYKGGSAKLEQLLELVEECRSAGKRMLVFSQFTGMLELIGRELGASGVPYFYLDGSTPAAERIELCSRFNAGERDLFLISLKAGGTGLNLTGADTVVLYDLWWNPAVEQQAADRAHRIGQKNVVQVIRLVAQGTVENKMYELQQRKKSLIEEVIQPGGEGVSSLSEQDIRDILMLE